MDSLARDTSPRAWMEWFSKPLPGALFVAVGVGASFAIGLATHRYVLPVLNALFLYPVLILNAREKRGWRNAFLIALWGFLLNAVVIALVQIDPELMAVRIINGDNYTEEMFHWIQTGEGAEGNIRLFLPLHLKFYGLLLALSALTGGFGGLVLAAALINFMAFYVGRLVLDAVRPLAILLIGWPIWSIIRGVGFLAAVVGLSEAFYDKVARKPINWQRLSKLLKLSVICILLDIVIKATLAEFWRWMLQKSLYGG